MIVNDPRDDSCKRLDQCLAFILGGVDQVLGINHHADMTGKEYQISVLQRCSGGNFGAQAGLLHVAVAWCFNIGSRKTALDQSGTIKPDTTAPAPDIGFIEK